MNPRLLPIHFAQARVAAELDLLACLLNNPAKGYGIARAMGLRLEHFSEPDARMIFTAIALHHAEGLERIYFGARGGLRLAGCWEERELQWQWNEATGRLEPWGPSGDKARAFGAGRKWCAQELVILPRRVIGRPEVFRWAVQRVMRMHAAAEALAAAWRGCFALMEQEAVNQAMEEAA